MRLIDADALRDGICAECTLNGEKCLGDDCDWDAIGHIKEAPTINAVPVEWLKRRMEKGMDARVLKGDMEEAFIARSCWNVMEVWKRGAKA